MRVHEGTPTQDDDDAVELSCGDILSSPVKTKAEDDMDDANHDKELEELMAVESTAQACIMHALRIVSHYIFHTVTPINSCMD